MRWVPRMLLFCAVLAAVAAGGGCGLGKRVTKGGQRADEGVVEDMRRGRRPMGQVVVVDRAGGFVLVRSPLASITPDESTLVVKAQGTAATTGTLKVTPERKRHLVAADIVEGTPMVGEVVFFQTGAKVESTTPPPADSVGSGGVTLGGEAGEERRGDGGFLPPLGEPSGPREWVPQFPGLDPVPDRGRPLEPAGVEPAEAAPVEVEPIEPIELEPFS